MKGLTTLLLLIAILTNGADCAKKFKCRGGAPENGSMRPGSGRVKLGRSAKYSCNEGFRLVGRRRIRCTTELATLPTPVCAPIKNEGGNVGPNEDCPNTACFANPCDFASCPAHPGAECRANYCNGCTYNYFMNGRKVKCGTGKCPDVPMTDEPCVKECSNDLDCPFERRCCGNGCVAKCMEEVPGKQPGLCPDGSPPRVRCATNACEGKTCTNFPAAECRVDLCRRCEAYDFFLNGEKLLSLECGGECAAPLHNCFANPCDFASCPAHPGAECRPNYCNGCTYNYFVNGRKVKYGTGKCPVVPRAQPCTTECNEDNDCPFEQRCCKNNGCNAMCMPEEAE